MPSLVERLDRWLDRPLVVAALCAGLYMLAAGFCVFDLDQRINPDAFKWHDRTAQFWAALASGQWEETFQHHPGVTFMWLAGASMRLLGAVSAQVTPESMIAAKLPLALFGALLGPVTFLLLLRLLGQGQAVAAFVVGLLLATEPFIIAHARSMHLGMLVTAFGWFAALCAGIAIRERSLGWSVATGILLGLAVLSKISGAAVAVGVAAWFLVEAVRTRTLKLLPLLAVTTASAVALCYLLWPALLANPATTLSKLLTNVEGEVVSGHLQFSLGETSLDPGPAFYAIVMLVKTTPEVVLALPLGLLVAVFARDGRAFVLRGLLITYILPLALILISPKKTSRYFLPFLPLLLTLATFGFVWLGQRVRRYLLRWQILGVRHLREHLFLAALVAGIVIVVARGARIANVWPLPITWCSTLPGRPAEELVTLGWGEGMKEVALWLKSNTSTDNPRVWGSIYVSCMSPWMSFHHVDQPTQAQFVVRYLSEEQRGVGQNTLLRLVLNNLAPLHEVWLAGRLYARIYPGPKHSGYYTHKTGQPRSWP